MAEDDFVGAYLDEVQASGLFRERVNSALTFYQAVYGASVFSDVLATDLVDIGTGERTWQSLWLWGPGDLIAECKNFLVSDNRDTAAISTVSYWSLETTGTEGLRPSDNATAKLHFSSGSGGAGFGGIGGDMTASGSNARHLLAFFSRWVVPRIGLYSKRERFVASPIIETGSQATI